MPTAFSWDGNKDAFFALQAVQAQTVFSHVDEPP